MKVIRYRVEAADNAKFLASLEKCSHTIYLEVSKDKGEIMFYLFPPGTGQDEETTV